MHHQKIVDAELPVARLNVDYKEERNSPEFRALTRALQGDEGAAWERLLRFRDIAQDWYAGYTKVKGVPLLSAISEVAFARESDLEVMIEVGYAFRDENGGVRATNERDHFHWLIGKRLGGVAKAALGRDEDGKFPSKDGAEADPGADPQLVDPASSEPADAPAHAGQLQVQEPSAQPGSSSLLLSLSSTQQDKHPLKIPQNAKRRDRDELADGAAADVLRVVAELITERVGQDAESQAWRAKQASVRLDSLAGTLVGMRGGTWEMLTREWYRHFKAETGLEFERGLQKNFRGSLALLATRSPTSVQRLLSGQPVLPTDPAESHASQS